MHAPSGLLEAADLGELDREMRRLEEVLSAVEAAIAETELRTVLREPDPSLVHRSTELMREVIDEALVAARADALDEIEECERKVAERLLAARGEGLELVRVARVQLREALLTRASIREEPLDLDERRVLTGNVALIEHDVDVVAPARRDDPDGGNFKSFWREQEDASAARNGAIAGVTAAVEVLLPMLVGVILLALVLVMLG